MSLRECGCRDQLRNTWIYRESCCGSSNLTECCAEAFVLHWKELRLTGGVNRIRSSGAGRTVSMENEYFQLIVMSLCENL